MPCKHQGLEAANVTFHTKSSTESLGFLISESWRLFAKNQRQVKAMEFDYIGHWWSIQKWWQNLSSPYDSGKGWQILWCHHLSANMHKHWQIMATRFKNGCFMMFESSMDLGVSGTQNCAKPWLAQRLQVAHSMDLSVGPPARRRHPPVKEASKVVSSWRGSRGQFFPSSKRWALKL